MQRKQTMTNYKPTAHSQDYWPADVVRATAPMQPKLSDEKRHILRHALGLERGSREYRNHFVTGPGSSDYANCEDLVGAGLMTKRPGHALSGGDPVYTVTEAGKMAARSCGCQLGTCESKPTGCRMAEEVKPGSGAQ
jgi:hypothetical protein